MNINQPLTVQQLSAKAPCPRRQLLMYVAHVFGRGARPITVYARDAGARTEGVDGLNATAWQPVGHVAAGTRDAVDDNLEALIGSVQLQQRLILEHSCRLYKPLRKAKRANRIELGLDFDSAFHVVPTASSGDASQAQMLTASFVGLAPQRNDGRPSHGIYAEFAQSDIVRYDRDVIVGQICDYLESSKNANDPDMTIFAWKNCGYATKARKMLDEYDIAYTNVILGRYSPMHAELAMMTGRTTVPYIFEQDAFRGGCESDADLPGLEKTLVMRDATAKSQSNA